MLSASRRKHSFGVGERESVALLIDCEEDVALVHELVIPHANIIDVTENVGRDCNNIGADPSISGPWRVEIIPRYIVAKQTSRND